MDLSSSFCLVPLFLIVALHSGEAVQCFECNSGPTYDGDPCANVVPTSNHFVKNCTELGFQDGLQYERCRTMVQDVEGDVRIVRSCATWPADPEGPNGKKVNRCIDRTGTSKIKVRYCECDGDLCNGAERIYGSLFLFFLLLACHQSIKSLCR